MGTDCQSRSLQLLTLSALSIIDMPSRSAIEKSLAPMRARTAAISSRISRADSGCFASSQRNHVNELAEVSCPARRRVLRCVMSDHERIADSSCDSRNLVYDFTVRESGLWIFRTIGTQKNAHDIAAVAFDDTFTHNPTRDLPNTAQVVPETTILASRKVDQQVEDRLWKVPPERFEQRIERTMVQRVDAVCYARMLSKSSG